MLAGFLVSGADRGNDLSIGIVAKNKRETDCAPNEKR
jgi:hypothetical protein